MKRKKQKDFLAQCNNDTHKVDTSKIKAWKKMDEEFQVIDSLYGKISNGKGSSSVEEFVNNGTRDITPATIRRIYPNQKRTLRQSLWTVAHTNRKRCRKYARFYTEVIKALGDKDKFQ